MKKMHHKYLYIDLEVKSQNSRDPYVEVQGHFYFDRLNYNQLNRIFSLFIRSDNRGEIQVPEHAGQE